jgi:glycosyltransferase involved in cell wall biosynthesis
LLVPHGDPGRLADGVVRILDDPALRARLVASGFAWAAGFDWERVADATEALIERTIAAG